MCVHFDAERTKWTGPFDKGERNLNIIDWSKIVVTPDVVAIKQTASSVSYELAMVAQSI